ncbi:LOW QUALITY PROTEIN: hypothetical protein, conserved [Eimeria necatrix]|uniref:Uncharacterized protein n=1 Tax=Eimeria necatrix TaxID=51315 RepID=U6MIY5_9EIME|nr:LOW QUALITY PROTEIN: hypothetical protein, conserved [Eimeria necatrix]CDJ64192.1 hypothetical protein, conserved [Eimeria necatrix]
MPVRVGLATCGSAGGVGGTQRIQAFQVYPVLLQLMSGLSPAFVARWKEANCAGSVSCVPPRCARHSRATQPHVVPSVQQLGTSSTMPDAYRN